MIKGRENCSRGQNGGRHNRIRATITASKPKRFEAQTGSTPYVPDTLYLFCGRRTDRIKGLVWEKDGWLMLFAESRFQWPRNADEVRELTPQQFRWLLEGLTISPKKSVRTVKPPEYIG